MAVSKRLSWYPLRPFKKSVRIVSLVCLPVLVFAGLAGCTDDETAALDEGGSKLAALQAELGMLSGDVERVEAVGAIKRLQHAYGHYSELGLWHDFADLFAEDAVAHYPDGNLDREGIRQLFLERVGQGRLGLAEGRLYPHINLAPVVTLGPDGQTARARWRIIAMLGGYGGNATWAYGVYENSYVRRDGTWQISELNTHIQVSGAHGEDLNVTVDGPLTEPTVAFHYDPEDVGTPLLKDRVLAVPDENSPTESLEALEALGTRLASLEHRIAEMTDKIAVTNLQHAYGYYLDRKLWDDVADLFAEGGTMELGQRGVYVGKDSIRAGLEQFGPAGLRKGEVNDHVSLETVVTISPDGRTAKARGGKLIMTGENGKHAEWRQGIYENEYVKVDGSWKIRSVHYYPRLITGYDEGWAKDARPAETASQEYPPDEPPTETYEIYPKFHIPAFHFSHPVTGRAPQYPQGNPAARVNTGFESSGTPQAETAAPETVADFEARLAEATRKLDIIAAYHAAENVTNAYSYYRDEHMWDEAAELFASEGWREMPLVGTYIGRTRIKQSMATGYGTGGRHQGFLALHQTTQPVIHVAADGQSAKVRTRLFQVTAREGGDDAYVSGIYENRVVQENGAWKIASMDLDYTWAASYREGWGRVSSDGPVPGLELPDLGADFPPDRPLRGPASPPFPNIEAIPFHYTNPVSGRTPARLLP